MPIDAYQIIGNSFIRLIGAANPIRPRREAIERYSNLNYCISGLTRTVKFGLLSIIYSILSLILGEAASVSCDCGDFGGVFLEKCFHVCH